MSDSQTYPTNGIVNLFVKDSISMLWSSVPFSHTLHARLSGVDVFFLLLGESGLGKSTLVNTLFNASLYSPKNASGPTSVEVPQTVNISAISADIEENGVRLRLNVVDTPGFGDFVNNEDSYSPFLSNILI